jgi:hypothetical protein
MTSTTDAISHDGKIFGMPWRLFGPYFVDSLHPQPGDSPAQQGGHVSLHRLRQKIRRRRTIVRTAA